MGTATVCKPNPKDVRWRFGKWFWPVPALFIMGAALVATGIQYDRELLAAMGFVPLGSAVIYCTIQIWHRIREG